LTRKANVSARADVAAHPDLMRGLMTSVVAFMAQTGMSSSDIGRVFQSCLAERQRRGNRLETKADEAVAFGCDTVAGAVLRAWHRFPRYLDDSARPIPLKVDGPDPSLSSLISSQSKKANPADVIKSMINASLLRPYKLGRYLPAKDSATIESLDPLSVDHIAKTVMRLVETASRNVTKSKNKLSLIERYAHVPDLTEAEAKAFAGFSRQQGQACLDAIEDWLETRQVGSMSRGSRQSKGVNAGVHIFAYLGGTGVVKRKPTRAKVAKRATSSREAHV
jgi:hypothetical protein